MGAVKVCLTLTAQSFLLDAQPLGFHRFLLFQ